MGAKGAFRVRNQGTNVWRGLAQVDARSVRDGMKGQEPLRLKRIYCTSSKEFLRDSEVSARVAKHLSKPACCKSSPQNPLAIRCRFEFVLTSHIVHKSTCRGCWSATCASLHAHKAASAIAAQLSSVKASIVCCRNLARALSLHWPQLGGDRLASRPA